MKQVNIFKNANYDYYGNNNNKKRNVALSISRFFCGKGGFTGALDC